MQFAVQYAGIRICTQELICNNSTLIIHASLIANVSH